jgi:hypothetical protein
MTAKTPKTPTNPPLYVASTAPGGLLPSAELDRANEFASKRLALETAIALPRDQIADALRSAGSDWADMFESHASELMQAAARADSLGHVRELEALVLQKVSLFSWGESSAVTLAPKHPDRFQIKAAEIERLNAVVNDKHRVRHWNY